MTDVGTDGGTAEDEVAASANGTDADEDDAASYSVVARSYRRSVRASDSLTFRSYAIVSALVALLLIVTVLLALPVWIAQTIGHSALNKIGRGVLPLIVLGLLVPLFAPVLYVARNHREGAGSRRGDAALGAAGYLFVLSIYLALVISAPADARTEPAGTLAPVVEFFYALPALSALAAPVTGALVVFAVQRVVR